MCLLHLLRLLCLLRLHLLRLYLVRLLVLQGTWGFCRIQRI
jgi:hypothetical protein